jgi:hypothetical protein
VRTYFSPARAWRSTLFRAYPNEQTPGLRLLVPTPEYMLEVKLMALRIEQESDRNDLEDIVNLMQVIGLPALGGDDFFAALPITRPADCGNLHLDHCVPSGELVCSGMICVVRSTIWWWPV